VKVNSKGLVYHLANVSISFSLDLSPTSNPAGHAIVIHASLRSSEVALENHTRLKPIVTFQSRPPIDRTSFHTDHSLVSILWLEITNRLRSLLPRVPDDRVCEVISDDIEDGLALVENRGGVLLQRLVHAVDGAVELELVAG